MKKIISLFQRNYEGDRLVRNEIVPGAEWVINGEGKATRKFDGTCCMVNHGILFKRYDAKHDKTPPPRFIAAQDPDPVTGHCPGWIEVGNGNEDRWFREPFGGWNVPLIDGTYELCGPKIQGNPEHFEKHVLVPHGHEDLPDAPRTFEALKEWFRDRDIEGIVWWHPDRRMVKIKKKDFWGKR